MKLDIPVASMSFEGLVTPREVKRDHQVEDERDDFYLKFEFSRTKSNLDLSEIFIQFEFDLNYFG